MFTKPMIALLCALAATSASAKSPATVTITDAFAQPSISRVGVAFFTATSSTNDTIVGTTSDCCKAVEIHRNEMLNGIMHMRRVAKMNLKKGDEHRIQPDATSGEHMMLIGLKQPLKEGGSVAVTFTFEKAPAQTVTFPVHAAASHAAHENH